MILDFSRYCKIWRKIALGCAQELGERRDTSRSPLGSDRAPLSFPALGVADPPLTCFSLFPSTDTITTPTLTLYHARVLPVAWMVALPSLVTLLGFNFGICASPALPTRAPWIPWQPTLRKRYTMATTTATNTTQQELKLTHSLLSSACRTTGISCTAGLFLAFGS